MVPPHITIRYDPRLPGAKLASSESVTLVLATRVGMRYESTAIPMTRAAGSAWQAEYTPKRMYIPGYSIFFFQDEKGRADNNGAQYWELLDCQNPFSVIEQASTYEGRLLAPGIQRPPELSRALDIVRNLLKEAPTAYMLYPAVWRYELELAGGSAAAYEQVGTELDALVSAHGDFSYPLHQVVGFVASRQQKLPARVVQRFREAVTALPLSKERFVFDRSSKTYRRVPMDEISRGWAQREALVMLAGLDFAAIGLEEADLQKKADDYLAFAAKNRDPEISETGQALQIAYHYKDQLNDVAGAEAALEKWAAFDPTSPIPPLTLAEFYVARKIKPVHALQLLDSANRLQLESEAPSSHRHFQQQPGRSEFVRGRAHWMLNDLPSARADLEAAAAATSGRPDVLYALGQVREQMSDTAQALDAYAASASAPYQESPAARDAYERLFLAQKLGSKRDAEQKLLARASENTRHAAAVYTPVAMTRAAPDFAFTDLAGKQFDNAAAKGKPTVLTFWSIWCAPCVAEMPAIEKFQMHHPDANLLAVEIGSKAEDVKSFLLAHNFKTLHVAVRTEWPRGFGAGPFPTTIVLDRFGQIEFVHAGQMANVDAILGEDLSALPGSR
jgi:thiol-disulfide isomerase/thioredoxin